MKRMNIGLLSVLCMILAFSLSPTLPVKAVTAIYVPDNYPTIQAAVNAASPGDTIIVRDGTYIENIDVNKSLTIQSENGAEATFAVAESTDYVFEITANGVTINGFDISGAIPPPEPELGGAAGIYVMAGKEGTIITNDRIHGNGTGIYLNSSIDTIINGNNINLNMADGIYLSSSSNNTITGNTVNSNGYGISLASSSNNTVSGNSASNNGQYGIYLNSSNNNVVNENSANSNGHGIVLISSSANTINGNSCNSNNIGIYLNSSGNNTVSENNATNNEAGIFLDFYSSNNVISHNTYDSNKYGIRLLMPEASNNTIYLNNFGNNTSTNAYSASSNTWHSPEKQTYIYNSKTYTNYLGNYWSNYTGSDADGDGIGNTPYPIDSDKDNYPLLQPFENYMIGGPPPSDTTAPSVVTNLAVDGVTTNSITLTWKAPGDDGNVGTATTYDIRYSTSPITEANWASATQCTGEPAPKIAGSAETFTVTNLSPATTYYFALKTADEVPNWSGLSNVAVGTTVGIRIVQPNGGEIWAVGSRQNITWTSSGVAGYVNISLSRDGGTSWQNIISGTPNDGSEDWLIVGPPTAQTIIKVASAAEPTVLDTSNGSFTILAGPARELTLHDLKITKTNLDMLNSFPTIAYDPVPGSSTGYEKLLWDFGRELDVPDTSKGFIGNYTQLADNYGYLPGECVSAIKALSRNNTLTRDWIMGDSVIAGCVIPGTAIATFSAPGNKYPSLGGGHAAIFESYIRDSKGKIIGFFVWDQNWDNRNEKFHEGVVGKHAIYRSGKGVAKADSYNVVQVP